MSQHYNLTDIVVDEYPYWRFEETISMINELVEEEDKRRKTQEDAQKSDMPNFNPGDIMGSINSKIPKL